MHALERRMLLHGGAAFDLHVNFQPGGSAVPSGYVLDKGDVFADRGNGFTYGWNASAASATRDRNASASPDQRYDTLVHTQLYGTRTWEVAVPNGQYSVHIVAGDPSYFGSVIKFNAEGVTVASGNQTSSNKWVEGEAVVMVTDGRLTISNAAGASNNKICFADIMSVDDTQPPPTAIKINFQPSGAALPAGYLADAGAVFGDRGNGSSYGWSALNSAFTRDRNSARSPDQRYDTLNHFKPSKWELALPNGIYSVHVVVGDPVYIDSVYGLDAEGAKIVGGTPSSQQHWFEATKDVTISDGRLTLTNSAGSSNNRICFIEVAPQDVLPPPANGNTITWTTGAASIPRSEAMTVTVDGKMYVFGGYLNTTYTPTRRVDVYDPAANTWTRLTDSDMPVGLTHAGIALFGRQVIVAGGYPEKSGGGQTFATAAVYSFNLDTHQWTTLPSLPSARGGGALVNLDGTLHFFGGSDSGRIDRADHWSMNLLSAGPFTWVTRAAIPTKRNHMGAVALDGKIYAIGGQQNQDAAEIPQSAVEVYDPASDSWSSRASLPFGRSHIAGATLVIDGRIVVLGGEKTYNSVINNVSAYDPATDSWTEMTPLPANRNGGVAAYIDNLLIYSNGRFNTTTYRGTIS
jgi:N-acetylneuraminic acid mutarotase